MWRLRGEVKGGAEHLFGFVEQRRVFGEEGDDRLAGGDAVAELDVHLETGLGTDGVAGLGAAGAKALHCPAYFGAVHGREVAVALGVEDAGRLRLVEAEEVVEDAGVAAVGSGDLEPALVGRA